MPRKTRSKVPNRFGFDPYGNPFGFDRFDTFTLQTPDPDTFQARTGYRSPQAIVDHERRGMEDLVKSEKIPRELATDKDYRPVLEAMGFKFLEGCTDELFVNVKFPEGWTRDHDPRDYRTEFIFDDKKRARILTWYKAASYDRKAYGYPVRRFEIMDRTFDNYSKLRCYLIDRLDRANATLHVVYMSKEYKLPKGVHSIDEVKKIAWQDCKDWATEHGIKFEFLTNWDDPQLPSAGPFPPWSLR